MAKKQLHRSHMYRIYPTPEQEALLSRHFGHCRFVFNYFLNDRKDKYINQKISLNYYDNAKALTALKKELPWLKEVNSQSLQASLQQLDRAYKKFYNGGGFPKFKTKHNSRQSFLIIQGIKLIDNRLLEIPKIKKIKIKVHRSLAGTIKAATIVRTPTGKYFVSILCGTDEECTSKPKIVENTTIGVDLGIKDFAITSKDEVIQNPKFLRKNIQRLKVLQCRASKKQKGSQNRKKVNKRIALLHEKIRNKRQDFLHKVSSRLVSENQTICLEDLAVSNMIKNHNLAQAISDVSWSEFNRMIEYKAEWYGVNILRIGRFAPSSKTCECGALNKDLKLSDRVWKCKSCGRVNERDLLAARNIKKFALHKENSGQELPVEPVEMSTLVESVKQEAHRSLVGG